MEEIIMVVILHRHHRVFTLYREVLDLSYKVKKGVMSVISCGNTSISYGTPPFPMENLQFIISHRVFWQCPTQKTKLNVDLRSIFESPLFLYEGDVLGSHPALCEIYDKGGTKQKWKHKQIG